MPSNQENTVSRPGRLAGKVALIIGAGTGIGECAAKMFAAEGARVALADIQFDAVKSVALSICPDSARARAFAVDVTSDDSVRQLMEDVVAGFGALHCLFNTAGGSLPQDSLVTDVPLDIWDKTMNLDLRGTLLGCRYAIPKIVASGGGSVVNMSSGAALRGSGKAHIYSAAKGAIVSVTRNLAGAYAKDGVRANAICCGRINTQRIRDTYGIPGQPGKSEDSMKVDDTIKAYPYWFGEPEDVAGIALFLASDESRMITGASIPADGGRSAY
ncbi:SDR family NAD(P)-dependent oxidoreductase [Parapusillimonas sp. JC17]|uniref:SDR family NAD(P)-dependent oxidoreductase n=1 Tax=Parapusillimonas sp. JC17 TaxID=3445768 RepID=UPI003F9F4634